MSGVIQVPCGHREVVEIVDETAWPAVNDVSSSAAVVESRDRLRIVTVTHLAKCEVGLAGQSQIQQGFTHALNRYRGNVCAPTHHQEIGRDILTQYGDVT